MLSILSLWCITAVLHSSSGRYIALEGGITADMIARVSASVALNSAQRCTYLVLSHMVLIRSSVLPPDVANPGHNVVVSFTLERHIERAGRRHCSLTGRSMLPDQVKKLGREYISGLSW